MRLIFMGPPGAGKGTQTAPVAEKFGIPVVSSGDMFRAESSKGTPRGQRIGKIMEGGDLVPDDLTIEVVMNRLGEPDCSGGFLLDGFPRTAVQAEALDAGLANENLELDAVVYLDVPDDIIIERMAGRRICRSCSTPYHMVHMPSKEPGRCDKCGGELYLREDDKPETVMARLKTYSEKTATLISYYNDCGLLKRIPGTGGAEEVQRLISAALRHVVRVQ